MFRILKVIGGNAARAPVTVRLPGAVPAPEGFRGRVVLAPARCVACGTCAYVCVSGAITGLEAEGGYAWAYEPGRCAFCARCLDHCPGGALAMEGTAAPAYTRPGALRVEVRVPFPPCARCGAPTRPATDALLARAFPPGAGEGRARARLCERCRRREAQAALAAAAGALGRDEQRPSRMRLGRSEGGPGGARGPRAEGEGDRVSPRHDDRGDEP